MLMLAAAMPAGVVAFMVVGQAVTTQVERLPQALPQAPDSQGGPVVSDPAAQGSGLLTGVLYTRGVVRVEWNGRSTPVNNGSYAYVGGETLVTGKNDMGVLHLGKRGRVYVCPNSRVSLSRLESKYRLDVNQGTSRFAFSRQTAFDIAVGNLSILPDDPAVTEHVGEVRACSAENCQVMALRGRLKLIGSHGETRPITVGKVARVELETDGPLVVVEFTVPAELLANAVQEQDSVSGALSSANYLCRIEEVAAYSELTGLPATAAGAPRAAGDPLPTAAPEAAPPVEPPVVPPLLVTAPPLAPEAFDPEALPPPAAGPAVIPLTVPAPVVPIVGTGGGAVATRS